VDAIELIGFLEARFQEFLSFFYAYRCAVSNSSSSKFIWPTYLIEPSSGDASAKTARDLTYSLRCLFLRVENELAW
jgi:hypothetical protein